MGIVRKFNLTLVGTSRCDVPAREAAGGSVAPLDAARTAQRAVPTFPSTLNCTPKTFRAQPSTLN
jgi:hypothetical protein